MIAGVTYARLAMAFGSLLLLGAIKIPLENHLRDRLSEARFRESEIDFALRDDLGANLMAVALGGSRSLVATIVDFQAFDHWQRSDYDRVDLSYRWIHKLQPDSFYYWDWAAWQAAYNAASHVDGRHTEAPSERPDGWEEDYDRWVERGIEILEEATKRLPDDYRLYGALAMIHQRRVRNPDPCEAARYYKRAMECPDSKDYYRRFYLYQLARCPGSEREAYVGLREIYDKEGLRYLTIVNRLRELEDLLDIPDSDRIPR